MRAREPASFWREIRDIPRQFITRFSRLLATMSQWRKKVVKCRSFIILRSEERLTSFNKNNRANFSGAKKKIQCSFSGSIFFENKRKDLKSNLVLEVVLVLESKGL